ncbi:MAG: SBBP repeat-containing protein [Candidatus Hermodarchaeota archaeon]
MCKLSVDGSSLLYSTFLGGYGDDYGQGIAVDSAIGGVWPGANNAYITGYTGSVTFPTTPGAINETHNGGTDVFVCKLSADGSSLLYSTLLGGLEHDFGEGIAIDSANNTYVTGTTTNAAKDFPTTPGAINETHNGGPEGSNYAYDVFVCKLSADGSNLQYSTFLGGSGNEWGYALTVDSANNTYVTGVTVDAVTDFPATSGAINETIYGSADAFICKISVNGSILLYSTFLGGSGNEEGKGIAVDSANNIYVTGITEDAVTDFPTTPGAYDETHNGNYDVFVCKIAFMPPAISLNSPANGSINQAGTTIDLSIIGIDSSVNHVLYNWDDGTNATLTAPYDLTLPSSEGQHILRVYANDTLGNWAHQTYIFTTGEPTSTTSTTTPTSTPGLELLTVLATIGLLVLFVRKKRKPPTN